MGGSNAGTAGGAGSGTAGSAGGTGGSGTAGAGGSGTAGAGGSGTAGAGGGTAGNGNGGRGGGNAGAGGGTAGNGNGGRGGGNAGAGGSSAGAGGSNAGAGGRGGAAGGTGGRGGAGGATCRAADPCTPGDTCTGTCNTRGLQLECACPQSGQYLCQSTMCSTGMDAGTDGGLPTCAAGTSTGDNCNPNTDDICETNCSSATMMNRTCLCAPTGGAGNRGQWACTALMMCTP